MANKDETLVRYRPGPLNRRAVELVERPLEPAVPPGALGRLATFVQPRTTRGQFAARLLKEIGRPPMSETRMLMLMAWMQAEGDAGRFNPLNTTWVLPDSTPFNGVGVQNYANFEDGVRATALTLNYGARHEQHGYKPIRHALFVGADPRLGLEAVELSSWGTGGLAQRVYQDTKNDVLLAMRFHPLAR